MIVLEARSAREGGAQNFVVELLPRLAAILEERGERVEVITGPPASIVDRLKRRMTYLRAQQIFHTGNRATFAPYARQIVIMRDRGLFPTPGAPPRRGARQRVRKALALHALAVADEVVVPTRSMVTPIRQLRERYRFLRETPIHVVHYGAPDWSPAGERPFRDPVALLLVGLAAAHKNMPFMATVLRLLNSDGSRRARLTLTATPDQVVDGKTLGEWFVEVTDHVSFLGSVSRANLPSLYAEHDIVVFPSHYEAFGQPLVEAMTMGIPIVAVDRDWAQEICADAATYAPLEDAQAWADAISTLVRIGRRGNAAGLARAEQFDWDETARSYADLLRR